MGELTQGAWVAAWSQYAHNGTTSVAGIVARRGDVYWSKRVYFDTSRPGGSAHVEMQLIGAFLSDGAKKLSGAAGDIRIVLFCKWSPCQSCLGVLQRETLKELDKVSERTFLKCVFESYYTTEKHAGTSAAAAFEEWPSEAAAEEAYATATHGSPLVKVTRDHEVGTGLVMTHSKLRRRLSIKKLHAGSSSSPWAQD